MADNYEGLRRTYLVARVSEHIMRVMIAVVDWHEDPGPAFGAMELEKLAEALEAVRIEDGIQHDLLQEVQSTRETTVGWLQRMAGAFPAADQTDEMQTSKRRGRRNA